MRQAREVMPLVCIVQTKIDLIQRDFPERHLVFLEQKFGANYRYNTDYVCISTTSKEGVGTMLAHIVVCNILLDHRGSLWIVDWEFSGFYPSRMESLAMHYVSEIMHSDVASPS